MGWFLSTPRDEFMIIIRSAAVPVPQIKINSHLLLKFTFNLTYQSNASCSYFPYCPCLHRATKWMGLMGKVLYEKFWDNYWMDMIEWMKEWGGISEIEKWKLTEHGREASSRLVKLLKKRKKHSKIILHRPNLLFVFFIDSPVLVFQTCRIFQTCPWSSHRTCPCLRTCYVYCYNTKIAIRYYDIIIYTINGEIYCKQSRRI